VQIKLYNKEVIMKNLFIKLISLAIIILSVDINSQNLVQSDFQSEIIPSFMSSGASTRLTVVFRATVQNLTPNSLYRYFNQGAIFTDLGGTNPGAGNPLLINPDSSNFTYTTGPSLTSSGNYGVFRTNSAGNFTGWFGIANTGNARFTAGNYVIPTIVIGDSTGVLLYRRALNDSIFVLAFDNTSSATGCTGIWGRSSGDPRDMVLLYDNVNGTGKPLALTYLENDGTTIANSIQYYPDSVNAVDGRWGTIIPNLNSNGVRRIEQRFLTGGSVVAFNVSSNGIWPSGANTVNPTGGTTPVIIDSIDAPLPVELISFIAIVNGNSVQLQWSTVSEINNFGFVVERQTAAYNWLETGFVKGKGNSVSTENYSFTDNNLAQGNYSYRLKQVDLNGAVEYSNIIQVKVDAPLSFALSQNYPNPFNPDTKIQYSIPYNTSGRSSNVLLKIYNILGNEIQTLVNEEKPAGTYEIIWNAGDLPSGVYFYRLISDNNIITKQMTLIK
jgi:hypothetical protein